MRVDLANGLLLSVHGVVSVQWFGAAGVDVFLTGDGAVRVHITVRCAQECCTTIASSHVSTALSFTH